MAAVLPVAAEENRKLNVMVGGGYEYPLGLVGEFAIQVPFGRTYGGERAVMVMDHGPYISGNIGVNGQYLNIGYAWVVPDESSAMAHSVALSYLRTQNDPTGYDPDQNFLGLHLQSTVYLVNVEIGAYANVHSNGSDDALCLFGLGIGF